MLTLFTIDTTGNCYPVDLLDLINESDITMTDTDRNDLRADTAQFRTTTAPVDTGDAVTVTVRTLTGSNVTALHQVADSLPIANLGKTVCTFNGTAAEALAAVLAAIDAAGREYGTRCFTVRSLHAVRRKLEAMA